MHQTHLHLGEGQELLAGPSCSCLLVDELQLLLHGGHQLLVAGVALQRSHDHHPAPVWTPVLTPAAAGLLTATHLLTTAGPWSPAAAAAASCLGLGWQSSSMALLAPATTLLSLPPSSSQHCRHMPIYGNTWCRCWACPRRRAAPACWPRSAPPRPTPPRAHPRLTGDKTRGYIQGPYKTIVSVCTWLAAYHHPDEPVTPGEDVPHQPANSTVQYST